MKNRIVAFTTLSFLLFSFLVYDRQPARADCRSYADILHNGSYAVADLEDRILSSCNADSPFVPASIIKIATFLVALQVLGPDYRFTTDFYTDAAHNLYIKGKGDPFLVSEEITLILEKLRNLGIGRINGLYIDDSMFNLIRRAPGRGDSDNPYDVPITALAVNFNSVAIRVDRRGRVFADEPQTPTLPLMTLLGRGRKAGHYRLNICSYGCRDGKRSARYAAELFRALQHQLGIPGDGPSGIRKVPPGARLLYTHANSKSLDQVVSLCLEHSNNFIANLVYLTAGAHRFGYPATWDKAKRTAGEVLNQRLGPRITAAIRMEDGAGLSRHDRVTARAMLAVLKAFKPYARLLQNNRIPGVKSGTLTGVYNYAGYLPNGMPMVILLSQKKNTRDRILRRLRREIKRK